MLHSPRSKKQIGVRLAQGAAVTAYGVTGQPVTGPTLSGCSVAGTKVTVKFNESLLVGGKMNVQEYFKGMVDPETVRLLPAVSLPELSVVVYFGACWLWETDASLSTDVALSALRASQPEVQA